MDKEKQKELAEFLDWAKDYTNNKLDDYGSSYLAQQYLKKHPSKAENLPISDVSKSYSGADKLPHEIAFEKERRYLNALTIKVTNHDTGHSNNINLYDLIDGMSNPIENGIQWAELWYSFKAKQLEFQVVESVG